MRQRTRGVAPRPTSRPQPKRATGCGGLGMSSIQLEGRTDGDMRGSYALSRERRTRGTGCEDCEPADCVRYSAVLDATYRTATTVTLPSVGDFPDLSNCQRTRVQRAITNVLAPHEQRHVQAFRGYAGHTSRPFQLTACTADVDAMRDARAQELFDAEDTARRDAAQARSDALDPFMANVDIDCVDAPPPRRRRR